ncbi:hypothetical protein G7Y89_g10417 [Cudoniella acicularis]|uniref:DUF1264 domain-containing protein n=1 Tax=Cudoniella acicularis TaxID=354080 RepID=A0A8H4RF47_9HELO|nr:hypothetical protein G7Y89_g10417 [Cudoniella acicularis]
MKNPLTLIFFFILLLLPFANATVPFGQLGPQGSVLFLNAFHFVSGNSSEELCADHFCAILNDDFLQCTVYNTATTPSHLVGIEYIISSKLFETLDMQERQLWHSHSYEVTSGFLIEPSMPTTIDDAAMQILVGTYGKTAHTWRYDAKDLSVPIGVPELVMGYTHDSQITPDFVNARDVLFGSNTTAIMEHREKSIKPPASVIPGADSWKYG